MDEEPGLFIYLFIFNPGAALESNTSEYEKYETKWDKIAKAYTSEVSR